MMTARLILAILSNLLEEAALVVIVLWGLPQLGIEIPVAGLVVMMVVWGVFSVFIYRMGSRALRMEPVTGLSAMVGSKGKVVRPLVPMGLVKIKGEIWEAKSDRGRIGTGEGVTVVEQDGLKLVVSKGKAGSLEMTK